MKKRYTEAQIIGYLNEAESGIVNLHPKLTRDLH